MKPSTTRLHRSEKGQGMVELALMLPVMLLLILGVIDLGMGFRTYIGLNNAAREGARWVSQSTRTDPNGALNRIAAEADTVGWPDRLGDIAVNFTPDRPVHRRPGSNVSKLPMSSPCCLAWSPAFPMSRFVRKPPWSFCIRNSSFVLRQAVFGGRSQPHRRSGKTHTVCYPFR